MMLRFKNGAVLQFENASKKDAELSITTGKNAFFYILAHNLEKFSSVAMIEGDRSLLEPVSYTHLDVYKRQGLAFGGHHSQREFIGCQQVGHLVM